jgi:hypothetical protein
VGKLDSTLDRFLRRRSDTDPWAFVKAAVLDIALGAFDWRIINPIGEKPVASAQFLPYNHLRMSVRILDNAFFTHMGAPSFKLSLTGIKLYGQAPVYHRPVSAQGTRK